MSRNAGAESVREAVDAAQEIKSETPRPLTRELPPADPYPVDALGDMLGPAARAIHDRVQAPIAWRFYRLAVVELIGATTTKTGQA